MSSSQLISFVPTVVSKASSDEPAVKDAFPVRLARAFFNIIFAACHLPEDDFAARVRKNIISLCFIALPLNLLARLPDTFAAFAALSSGSSAWTPVYNVCFDLVMMAYVVPFYTYQRVTQRQTTWVVGLLMLIVMCGDMISTASHDVLYHGPFTSMAAAVTALVCDSPARPAYVLACLVTIAIRYINASFNGPLMLPGADLSPSGPSSLFVFPVMSFLALVANVYFLSRSYQESIAKATLAAELSGKVADLLQRYDTRGVTALLDAYTRSEHADASLLSVNRALVRNLERYRPHLPNYVLDFDEEATQSSVPSSVHVRDARSQSNLMRRSGSGNNVENVSPRGPAADFADPSLESIATDVHGGDSSGTSNPVSTPLMPSAADPTVVDDQLMFTGKLVVATVVLDWGVENWQTATQLASDAATASTMMTSSAACTEVVLAIRDCCTITRASLHSFVGDRILLTWNATRRVAKSEASACRFVIMLRDRLARRPDVARVLAAAIATGPGRTVTAGDESMQLFACSSPAVFRRLETLSSIAVKARAVVCDSVTREAAQYDFVARGAVLLPASHVSATGDRIAYELLEERPMDQQRDEEWMYALQKRENDEGHNDPNSLITKAMQRFVQGDSGAALSLIARAELMPSFVGGRCFADFKALVVAVQQQRSSPQSSSPDPERV